MFVVVYVSELVGVLPNIGEADSGMETIQNAERRRDVVNDRPRRMTIEVPLMRRKKAAIFGVRNEGNEDKESLQGTIGTELKRQKI